MRVLVLNLQLLAPGISTTRNNYKDARLRYFCDEVMPRYDVLCLSEVWKAYFPVLPCMNRCLDSFRRPERLLEAAKAHGFDYVVRSAAPTLWSGKIWDSGLMILSRYPILKSSTMVFSSGLGAERLLANGALYARIALPTGESLPPT
eukprot:RCo047481